MLPNLGRFQIQIPYIEVAFNLKCFDKGFNNYSLLHRTSKLLPKIHKYKAQESFN